MCTRPLPTRPKFWPEATAIRSSKKGEKARALCVKPGVFTRKTAGGGMVLVEERLREDVCLGSGLVWQTSHCTQSYSPADADRDGGRTMNNMLFVVSSRRHHDASLNRGSIRVTLLGARSLSF